MNSSPQRLIFSLRSCHPLLPAHLVMFDFFLSSVLHLLSNSFSNMYLYHPSFPFQQTRRHTECTLAAHLTTRQTPQLTSNTQPHMIFSGLRRKISFCFVSILIAIALLFFTTVPPANSRKSIRSPLQLTVSGCQATVATSPFC